MKRLLLGVALLAATPAADDVTHTMRHGEAAMAQGLTWQAKH